LKLPPKIKYLFKKVTEAMPHRGKISIAPGFSRGNGIANSKSVHAPIPINEKMLHAPEIK